MLANIEITWKGTQVTFKPSFDLFMRIEEKVSFSQVADSVKAAGAGHVADLRVSHVAWVIFCCLRHAGADVRTPDEVQHAIFDGESLPDYGKVLGALILAYFGATPQHQSQQKKSQVKLRGKKDSQPSGPT